MYNVNEFGKRIISFRKKKGMTQEELAEKLNITAQAVSKWENGISLPDITILPFLSKELNTTMEQLFGNEEQYRGLVLKEKDISKFPLSKGDSLKLVHTYKSVGCYSEKAVSSIEGESVFFIDGSNANLKGLTILNRGTGDICFDFIDDIMLDSEADTKNTELNEVFDGITSFDISALNGNYKLVRSKDNKTYIHAVGSPAFINKLQMVVNAETLSIKNEQENGRRDDFGKHNEVVIFFGSDFGENIEAEVNGCGNIIVEVPFKNGQSTINGSGNITNNDIDNFSGNINGSGNIKCNKMANAKLNINGSGNIIAKEVKESLKISICGSGNVKLGAGKLDFYKAKIMGSGNINSREISTRTAKIVIEGSGDVIVGRVIEESFEKHSKNSTIKILARG